MVDANTANTITVFLMNFSSICCSYAILVNLDVNQLPFSEDEVFVDGDRARSPSGPDATVALQEIEMLDP